MAFHMHRSKSIIEIQDVFKGQGLEFDSPAPTSSP